MGVAFDLEVTRSRGADRLDAAAWLIGAAGLALASFQLASGPVFVLDGPTALRAGWSAVAATGAAVALWRAARVLGTRPPGPVGRAERLHVDDDGGVVLRRGGEPGRPMALRASCALPGLTLLIVAPYPGQAGGPARVRPIALRIGRDAVPADAWRRLHVWLRWIERGHPGP